MSRAITSIAHFVSLALLASISACVGTHMTRVRNVKTAPPPAQDARNWRDEADAHFAIYAERPVLAAGDERLEPIFGGISTLVYYGADFDQKLRDQRVDPSITAIGLDLTSACAAPSSTPIRSATAGSSTSAGFARDRGVVGVWLPVSIHGGAAPADATCGRDGTAISASGAAQHLCLFGRLSLQSDAGRDLIIVVHGLFDSSAQDYVRTMADALFEQGYSTLSLDMRDHGDSLRRALQVPLSLGATEAKDLVHAATQVRAQCTQVSRVGAIGVSGGGLDVISAYAIDGHAGASAFDAGMIAVSPLLDVNAAMRDMEPEETCSVAQTIELTGTETAVVAGLGATSFGLGAGIAQLISHDADAGESWMSVGVSALVGAALGATGAWIFDGYADGSASEDCLARSSVGHMFQDLLSERWQTLRANAAATPNAGSTLDDYLRRADAFYAPRGVIVPRTTAESVAGALRTREHDASRAPGRLLVVGAGDDPVTRHHAFESFMAASKDLQTVHTVMVASGGHGAMWSIQEPLMLHAVHRFFQTAPVRATPVTTAAPVSTPPAPTPPVANDATTPALGVSPTTPSPGEGSAATPIVEPN